MKNTIKLLLKFYSQINSFLIANACSSDIGEANSHVW